MSSYFRLSRGDETPLCFALILFDPSLTVDKPNHRLGFHSLSPYNSILLIHLLIYMFQI